MDLSSLCGVCHAHGLEVLEKRTRLKLNDLCNQRPTDVQEAVEAVPFRGRFACLCWISYQQENVSVTKGTLNPKKVLFQDFSRMQYYELQSPCCTIDLLNLLLLSALL